MESLQNFDQNQGKVRFSKYVNTGVKIGGSLSELFLPNERRL